MRMQMIVSGLAAGAIAAAASAGTVDLTTGVADWQVAYAPIPGDYPSTQPTFGPMSAAEVVDPGNIPGPWATTPDADWISTGTNPVDDPGFYKYTLTIDDAGPGPWNFSGMYTSDNQVISLTIAGVNLFSFDANLQSNPQQFQNFDQVFMTTGNSITIEAIVYNERLNQPTNPTGFILAGEAVLVPSPMAAGMAGVGLLGVAGVRRRRGV
jgi:hypothetical protein